MTLPPLPPQQLLCSCSSPMEILSEPPFGMLCRACGTWAGKVYADQAELLEVIAMRPPKKRPTLAEQLGLGESQVLCRSCLGREEDPHYDWLANRGECRMCRRQHKRERKQRREIRSAQARKARAARRSHSVT